MAYSPFQDGTQAFGIPDSPLTIPTSSGVVYIAEDIQISQPQSVVEIKDPNGVPIGQTFIPGVMTGTAKLQLATASTVSPPRNSVFSMEAQSWVVENVSKSYTQGAYTYVNITFRQKLN